MVIMSIDHVIQLAHAHLSDQKTYKLIKQDPTKKIVQRFNQYMLECRKKVHYSRTI